MDESGNYSSEFNATGKSNVIPEALSSSNAAPEATLTKEEPASVSASAEMAAASADRGEQQDLKSGAPDDSDQDLDFENKQPEPAAEAMNDATESLA